MEFSAAAQWIWTQGEATPRNLWLRARRPFHCPATLQKATLLLSADSRYELFVNGEWIGVGPVRSYPWAYSYDQYDVTSWLQRDALNALAIIVVHWGDFSFQYVRGRGALLCELVLELADGQVIHIGSDASWHVSPDPAMRRDTQRMAPQFGYEEHYDAQYDDASWQQASFDTSDWDAAEVLGPVGMAPWTQLLPRPIPFLTRDAVFPTRVLAAELAQPRPGYRWSFDLRRRIHASPHGLSTDAPGEGGKALATEIIAEQDCTATVHAVADYAWLGFSCNGQRIKGPANRIELHAGRNLFVARGSAEWPNILLETTAELQFDASRLLPAPAQQGEHPVWAYLAPFDERGEIFNQLIAASTPAELPETPRQPLFVSDNLAPDIFLLTKTQRFLLPTGSNAFCDTSIDRPQPRERIPGQDTPLIEAPFALLHQTGQATTLYPHTQGDLHLVIEFERLLIGYLVFEVDAPAGTIIDANMFEAIDDNGIFWTNLVHNSLRYTCREGHQTFRSRVRRGFRYVSLSIRDATRPIQFYNVRALLSTYPVEQRGCFTCNDTQLTRIWEVAAYTVRLCMEDTYTDCPTYEQTFYVGDARNSALVNAIAFGAYDLTERCLRLVAQSLAPDIDAIKKPGLVGIAHLTPDQLPSGWFNVIPMWTLLWIWNVWEHYQLTGRQQALQELFPAVQECLKRCFQFLTERDLLDVPDASNLVDWTPMDMPHDGEITANNVLLVECLRRASYMATTLADLTTSESERQMLHGVALGYQTDAEHIYQAINTYCWSEERGAYMDSVRDEAAYQRYLARMQTRGTAPESREQYFGRGRVSEPTNTLVLLCQCAPTERATRILPLVESAEHEDFVHVDAGWKPSWTADKLVPVGSPWFLFFTAETLIAHGKVETAINTIRKHWGYMLEKGSTTFWEMFRFWTDEHWTRSLCHGWAAGPAYFFSTQILGIRAGAPGYAHIYIEPRICGLRWARGSIPTPHGDVAVRWQLENGTWEIEIALPAGIPGTLFVSNLAEPPVLVSGEAGDTQQEGERWEIPLAAGDRTTYRLHLSTAM